MSSFQAIMAIEAFYREAVVTSDVHALGTGEEAFDHIRVGAILGLVGLAVVRPSKDSQPKRSSYEPCSAAVSSDCGWT